MCSTIDVLLGYCGYSAFTKLELLSVVVAALLGFALAARS